MTTTVAFLTRNCAVLGCDSLATTSRAVLYPWDLIGSIYEVESGGIKPKKDKKGECVVPDFTDILDLAKSMPHNQLPSYTKMFELRPAAIGVLFAGIAVIDKKSMRNLVDEFLASEDIARYLKGNHGVLGTTTRLTDFLKDRYNATFTSGYGPALEFTVVGYSKAKSKQQPEAYRRVIDHQGVREESDMKEGEHGFVFGGQHDVIERVTRGMDFQNYRRFTARVSEILSTYRDLAEEKLKKNGFKGTLPDPTDFGTELGVGNTDWLEGDYANAAAFSEQAAIDYVDFLVDLMIKSQYFGDSVPTVGGDIHIAIITKRGGFQSISREEYNYKGYAVAKR
jgi:hypothetical protein